MREGGGGWRWVEGHLSPISLVPVLQPGESAISRHFEVVLIVFEVIGPVSLIAFIL